MLWCENGLRTNKLLVPATSGGFSRASSTAAATNTSALFGIYRRGWGFSTSQDFNGDIALIACFASLWTPAIVWRWHADPLRLARRNGPPPTKPLVLIPGSTSESLGEAGEPELGVRRIKEDDARAIRLRGRQVAEGDRTKHTELFGQCH